MSEDKKWYSLRVVSGKEKSIKERIGTIKHTYADATDVKTPSTEMVRHSFSETDISYAMNTSNITRDEAIGALLELQKKY
jgi:transcription antitermination factor NusG